MKDAIIAQAINLIASLLLGSEVFTRILATVERWAAKEIAGAEKRHGVLDELQVIGLKLTESASRFGVELAVQYLKKVAK
jgi:hypothetical protein